MKARLLKLKKRLGRIVLDFLLDDYLRWDTLLGSPPLKPRLILFVKPGHPVSKHQKKLPTTEEQKVLIENARNTKGCPSDVRHGADNGHR